MEAYWWYMLKVSICIVVFYAFYVLMLRKCTFFLLNRLYLISGILLSFVVPVLNFSIFKGQSDNVFNMLQPILIEPEYDFFQPHNLTNHVITINYSIILPAIYFTGVSIMFFKLLFSILRIIRISNSSETYQFDKTKIIKVNSILPFSFFNMIFLPKNENSPMIIEHEMAHVRQFHWVDLLIVEIASVLLWFNPFVILYKSSLKLQHEYLADTSVIKDNNQIESYLGCMLRQIQVVSSDGLISQFYCKTIKKRIIMISKNKTSIKYLGVYILVIPLVCSLLLAFTRDNSNINSSAMVSTVGNAPSICPVNAKKVTITMGFGERINPITKKKNFHNGMDFAIAEGENIVAPADGFVIESKFDTKMGSCLLIKHDEEYSTFYAHFKSASVGVGDKIEKGQIIGITGNTGTFSTGPHLHYEVIKSGKRVNPEDYMPK